MSAETKVVKVVGPGGVRKRATLRGDWDEFLGTLREKFGIAASARIVVVDDDDAEVEAADEVVSGDILQVRVQEAGGAPSPAPAAAAEAAEPAVAPPAPGVLAAVELLRSNAPSDTASCARSLRKILGTGARDAARGACGARADARGVVQC